MCGITGFIAPVAVSSSRLATMTDIISYRGPDSKGYLYLLDDDENSLVREADESALVRLALGHRRLSIVDLSILGHQPMSYSDGRFHIVYNGEVYNYPELREELLAQGYAFSSGSDTEVILAAYQEWGMECLHKFNGMWSFAIYDHAKKTVFLARDRFGIKPLYYWISPDGVLYFGSEIKIFTSLPGWNAVVNTDRAKDFLDAGIIDHTNETLFSGVFQIRGGENFLIELEGASFSAGQPLSVVKWYKPTFQQSDDRYPEAVEKLRALLKDAVRLRLRADVPVGSCLSGGIDSTSITCLMNAILKETGQEALQNTFSAYADSPRVDESKWVEIVKEHINISSHSVRLDMSALLDDLPRATWHQDEPFGSSSILAQWSVFGLAAKQDVRVILDGQGADEHLAGYNPFYGARFAGLFQRFKWIALLREMLLCRENHGFSYRWMFGYLFYSLLPRAVTSRIRIPPHGAGRLSLVSALSREQLFFTNLPMLLHWEDRNSMAHSIESRVPFLDYRLVEYVMGLHDDFRLSEGVTKRVLRDAMAGIIPDRIRTRKDKIGFAAPEEEWLKGDGRGQATEAILRAIDNSDGLIGPSILKRFEAVLDEKARFGSDLWRVISFGIWMDVFKVSPHSS